MGEGPAGRTHGGGGRLDMARLEGEELDLLVRGWGQGLSRVLGPARTDAVVDGREDRWQGVVPGCVCGGVPESEGVSPYTWGGVWAVQEVEPWGGVAGSDS